jgi:hypothetical protein
MKNFVIYCRFGTKEQAMTTMERLGDAEKSLKLQAGRQRRTVFSGGALSATKKNQFLKIEYLPAISSVTLVAESINLALNNWSR